MDAITGLDADILRWVVTTFRAPWLDQPMVWVGKLGVWGLPFLVLGALVAAVSRDRRFVMALWRVALATVLASVVAVNMLKPMFDRARPFEAHADITAIGRPATGSSMPSGHASTAVAGAFALALMWPAGRAIAWAIAVVILFSRLYLGVHYPTDLLVGGLVGLACAYFATAATRAQPRAAIGDVDALPVAGAP